MVIAAAIFFAARLNGIFYSAFSAASFEEQFTGVMARLLMSDISVPWYSLPMGPQEIIGRTLTALMCAGSFRLFGTSLIALKLPALVFSLASFIGWHLFISRHATLFGVWLSAIFWLFPPPMIQAMAISSFGNHWENTFHMALVILFLDKWFHNRNLKTGLIPAMLFTGYSLVFCASALPFAIAVFIVLAIFSYRNLSVGSIGPGLVAFVIPLIPACFVTKLRTGHLFCIYNINKKSIGSVIDSTALLNRFGELFRRHIPFSGIREYIGSPDSFRITAAHFLAIIVFFSLIAVSLIVLLVRKENRWFGVVSGLFFIVFSLSWVFSGHTISRDNTYMTYRYFAVLYPFFFSMIGLLPGSAASRRFRSITALAAICVILPNAVYYFSNLRQADFILVRSASGINWMTAGEWIWYDHGAENGGLRIRSERTRYLEQLSRVTAGTEHDAIALATGGHAAFHWNHGEPLTDFLDREMILPGTMQPSRLYSEAGICMVIPMISDVSVSALAERIRNAPSGRRLGLYRGLGMGMALINGRHHRSEYVEQDLIPESHRGDVAYGYGFGTQISLWGKPPGSSDVYLPDILNTEMQRCFCHGFGTSLAWLFPDADDRVVTLKCSGLPPDFLPWIQWAYNAYLYEACMAQRPRSQR